MKHIHKPELFTSLKSMLVAIARKRGIWFSKIDVEAWVKYINDSTDRHYGVEGAMRRIRESAMEEGEKGSKFYPLDRRFIKCKADNGKSTVFAQYKARRVTLRIIKK